MKRSLNIILLSTLILVLGVISFLLYQLFIDYEDPNRTKSISVILSFFTALLPFAFTEVRKAFFDKGEYIKSENNLEIDDEDIFDIFIYGHSGSGKTTLIQRLFTYNAEPLQSTQAFDYYETTIRPNLNSLQNKKDQISLRIADYKGQDVNQILGAAKNNSKINALIIVGDIAPSYSDGRRLSEDEIIRKLKDSLDETIKERLKVHEKYLSEFLLQVVFKYIYNTHLRSVRLVINKIDLLEQLQQEGFISKTINLDDFAKSYFKEIEGHIQQFCKSNDITDFEVVTISTTKYQNINEMFSKILNKFIKSNNLLSI